jgi:predicted nucleic acid-binding protein
MRFWDSSALVPLCVHEPTSEALGKLLKEDSEVAVWWATPVECASALARLEREAILDAAGAAVAFERLDRLSAAWFHVEPIDEIREIARRMLRVHALRAADALQLAAAYIVAERRPPTITLVTLDDRVADAGAREGFVIERGLTA